MRVSSTKMPTTPTEPRSALMQPSTVPSASVRMEPTTGMTLPSANFAASVAMLSAEAPTIFCSESRPAISVVANPMAKTTVL